MGDQQPPPGGAHGDPLGYPLSSSQPTPEQRQAQQMQQAAQRQMRVEWASDHQAALIQGTLGNVNWQHLG
jgi:hypothetical protein